MCTMKKFDSPYFCLVDFSKDSGSSLETILESTVCKKFVD